MATAGTVLVMTFKDTSDANKAIRLKWADNEADGDDVSTLMDTIITNGSVFQDTPVSKLSAQFVSTVVRDVILS